MARTPIQTDKNAPTKAELETETAERESALREAAEKERTEQEKDAAASGRKSFPVRSPILLDGKLLEAGATVALTREQHTQLKDAVDGDW